MHQLRAKIDSLSTEIADVRYVIFDLEVQLLQLLQQDFVDSSTVSEDNLLQKSSISASIDKYKDKLHRLTTERDRRISWGN